MSSDPSEVRPRPEVVPYHPSQIKVEKHWGGRRTASIFCANNQTSQRPRKASDVLARRESSNAATAASPPLLSPASVSPPPTVHKKPSGSDCASFSLSSFTNTTNDDNSSVASIVSDVSELSVMSPFHSGGWTAGKTTSGSSVCSLSLSCNSSRFGEVVPGVHGRPAPSRDESRRKIAESQRKKFAALTKRYDSLKSGNHALLTSQQQRQAMSALRDDNFQLKRENVNLKSQLDSLQRHQRSLSENSSSSGFGSGAHHDGENFLKANEETFYELRSQLRAANDEILRLHSEATKSKVEARAKLSDLEAAKARAEKSSKETEQLREVVERLKQDLLSSEVNSNSTTDIENRLSIVKDELDTALKSRDWYREQLSAAQDGRAEAQAELVASKRENSTASAAFEALKGELEAVQDELERERRRLSCEREEFTAKLSRIEQEMRDQEAQLDQIQDEKDEMIAQLSERLTESENDLESVSSMTATIQELEEGMGLLRKRLEDRESQIEETRNENLRLHKLLKDTEESKVSKIEFNEISSKNTELSERLNELEKEKATLNKVIRENGLKIESVIAECERLRGHIQDKEKAYHDSEKELQSRMTEIRQSELKCETLEQELVEQHQCLDDARAKILRLQNDLGRLFTESDEAARASLSERDKLVADNDLVKSELSHSRDECKKLQQDLNVLAMKLRECPSPDPCLEELKDEVIQLRKRTICLEQFENEASDLRLELDEMRESKADISAKLLEAEKVFEEETDTLRSLLAKAEENLANTAHQSDTFESALGEAKAALDCAESERQRLASESRERKENMEEALDGLEETRKSLLDKQSSLVEAEDRSRELEAENEGLVTQLQSALDRLDKVERENRRLAAAWEEMAATSEETREAQCQRIERLEGFVSEYEREVDELVADRAGLQSQIMQLEEANGRLQSEAVVNETLKEQLGQLQRDLRSDTSLRQELVKSVEAAKANLGEEIATLETALKNERLERAKAEEAVALLVREKDLLELEVEKLISTHPDNTILKKAFVINHSTDDKAVHDKNKEIGDLKRLLEERRRTICALEDSISNLEFKLRQSETEVEDAKSISRLTAEKHAAAVERSALSHESLRQENASLSSTNESLLEERNNYRVQVQQMNLALRNSLEHIKQLRSRATLPSACSSAASSATCFSDLVALSPSPTPTSGASSAKNLNNLQACLASLKQEMTLLQSRLAPPEAKASPKRLKTAVRHSQCSEETNGLNAEEEEEEENGSKYPTHEESYEL